MGENSFKYVPMEVESSIKIVLSLFGNYMIHMPGGFVNIRKIFVRALLDFRLRHCYNKQKEFIPKIRKKEVFSVYTYIQAGTMKGATDAEQIQNAIAEAKSNGTNRVVISRRNDRTGEDIWNIDRTVFLPSDIEIVLDNAHLRLADGAFCNMFSNENITKDISHTPAGEQKNITLRGIGNAILDGGTYNGLSEKNSLQDGRPHISVNTTLLFFNVSGLRVENLAVINQRWWGMTNIFVHDAVFRNIRFEADISRVDSDGVHHPDEIPKTYNEIYVKNADGIDLRIGCHDVLIENITGFTEDDTVALTALGGFERKLGYIVEGQSTDIHDVKIRNIASDSYFCAVVRLLNDEGNKLYNIDIDGVTHVFSGKHPARPDFVVRIGDMNYAKKHSTLGDTHHISVKNVYSHGTYAVGLFKGLVDAELDNIVVADGGLYGFGSLEGGKAVVKNVRFGNFVTLSSSAKAIHEGSFTQE